MRKSKIRTFLAMIIFAVLCTTTAMEVKASDEGGLTISGLKKDGTEEVIAGYSSSEDGWNAAMERAANPEYLNKNGYDYIVVDLMGDWTAVDGQFTKDFDNGPGFNWDAVYIPNEISF